LLFPVATLASARDLDGRRATAARIISMDEVNMLA
jgi:hypothetical protein